MAVLEFPVDLTDARATAGREVSITVPVRYPDGWAPAAISSATSRARQGLQSLLEDAHSTLEAFPNGDGADLTVTGRLLMPWTSTWLLRKAAYAEVQEGAEVMGFEWQGFGPEDVSLLDLDAGTVEKDVHLAGDTNWYFDPTGESNPDGTVNYKAVVASGTREGLENFGAGVGAVGEALGGGAAAALGGLFKGLGTWWTIVLVLVVLLVALLALSYAFGGPRLLGGL